MTFKAVITLVFCMEERGGKPTLFTPKAPSQHSNRFALFRLLCNQSVCPAIVMSVGVPPLLF